MPKLIVSDHKGNVLHEEWEERELTEDEVTALCMQMHIALMERVEKQKEERRQKPSV